MKKIPNHTFEHIISLGNLLEAWQEFLPGKRSKPDVQEFQSKLMDNLLSLRQDLTDQTYRHGPYQHFKIADPDILWLLREVVGSFSSNILTNSSMLVCRRGLPLGNLTSQLLVNVYMNEFDQWVKHTLKAKHYVRYADDFVFLSHSKIELEQILDIIVVFLSEKLKLDLHPNKVSIKTFASGVDFLGWVHFADHRVLRTASKRRMLRRLKETENKEEVLQSYVGLLSHGNAYQLRRQVTSRSRGEFTIQ